MNRIEKFKEELAYIRDKSVKEFAEEAIGLLPDYFFEIPASSTGKYHPSYSLGEGGLLRHTKAAVRIAMELFRLDWWKFTPKQEDLIIVALILHDGWKSGKIKQKYTQVDHPLIAKSILSSHEEIAEIIGHSEMNYILSGIETHMGQWTNDYKTGKKILDVPKTKSQKFIHLADYLASRKCLEMNFDVNVSR